VTKKRKIILIGLAVTLALAVGVGGLVYAQFPDHEDVGGNKLIGVGEMGYEDFTFGGIPGPTGDYVYEGEIRGWDTQFIITNPNCEQDLTIEWVALIAGEDTGDWDAEEVIFEGTPEDWYWCSDMSVEIPEALSGHEVWQGSIAELVFMYVYGSEPDDAALYGFIASLDLNKYTLEVTWSGARYTGWWWWGYWRSGRPLTGWQKEKCRHMMWGYAPGLGGMPVEYPGLTISEAEMKVFPSRRPFSLPDWWTEFRCGME